MNNEKKLEEYIKLYVEVKGDLAAEWVEKSKPIALNFATKIDQVLQDPKIFKEMLDTYGQWMTDNDKDKWNLKTMANKVESWKVRRDNYLKRKNAVIPKEVEI